MSSMKYINPEGEVVEVPQADAAHFDKIGWEKADAGDQTPKAKGKKTNTDTNNK